MFKNLKRLMLIAVAVSGSFFMGDIACAAGEVFMIGARNGSQRKFPLFRFEMERLQTLGDVKNRIAEQYGGHNLRPENIEITHITLVSGKRDITDRLDGEGLGDLVRSLGGRVVHGFYFPFEWRIKQQVSRPQAEEVPIGEDLPPAYDELPPQYTY